MCVCACGHKRERERERKEERDWPHKFEGPLGKVCVVLTANLRKMSITLPTSKTFMKASRLYQSLPPRQLPRKYFLSEKISFNYWERGFKFISVFRDFLQMAVQGAVVHIKTILLILTCFRCCKQTDCQKPQICCLQRRCSRCITKTTVCRHTHTHTRETCNGSKTQIWFGKEIRNKQKWEMEAQHLSDKTRRGKEVEST